MKIDHFNYFIFHFKTLKQMIVWSGLGFLSAVIVIVCTAIFNSVLTSVSYHTSIGLVVAAAINWWVGTNLNSGEGRLLKDEETGEMIRFKRNHTLFWIPMQWWSVAFLLLAVSLIFKHN
ncbi:hypothetical protein [Larkinella rosea]|uniref:Uncharacterized protein n=1 Tax=Larkinella rosea TaxID=2025312 RepID=A0A3P1BP70_9BACT|nr:hypothetical protein [Larkinella rosea]RRB02835.1 hypothetical protein EHT25_20570 [Larkinella rosea]